MPLVYNVKIYSYCIVRKDQGCLYRVNEKGLSVILNSVIEMNYLKVIVIGCPIMLCIIAETTP